MQNVTNGNPFGTKLMDPIRDDLYKSSRRRQDTIILHFAFCILNFALILPGCSLFPPPLTSIADKTPQIQSFTPGSTLTQPTGWSDTLTLTALDNQGDNLVISWSMVSSTSSGGTLTRISDTQYQYTAPLNPGNIDTIQVAVTDGTFTNTYTATVTVPNPSDPASPNNVSLAGSSTTAALRWNANGESDLAGYQVLRATADAGPYTVVSTVDTSQLYYIDTDGAIAAGGPYYYTVQAFDASATTSNFASRSSLTPSSLYSDALPPNTPTAASSVAGENSVTICCTDLGDADAGGVVWVYEIWVSTDNVNFSLQTTTTNITSGGTLCYNFSGLTNGSSYYYEIVAIDEAGRQSTSSVITLTPADVPPAAPSGITVNATTGALRIAWDANTESDLLGYWVYRTTTANSEVSTDNAVTVNSTVTTNTSLYDTDVSSNASYHYRVKAADTDGNPTSLLSSFSDDVLYTAPEIYSQVDSIGASGSSLGEFSSPSGIGVDSAGRLYVSDTKNSRIQLLLSNGDPVTAASDTLRLPANIDVKTIGGQIVVLVTDESGATGEKIYQYYSNGSALTLQNTFGAAGSGSGQLTEAFGIAFNSNYIYASEIDHSAGEKVLRYQYSNRSYLDTFGSSDNGDSSYGNLELLAPKDVEVDASGQVYVLDSDHCRVLILDAAGTYVGQFGTLGTSTNTAGDSTIYLKYPEDIKVFESGGNTFIYIADTQNNRIVKCQLVGTGFQFVTSFGSYGTGTNQLDNPTGIALAPDGTLIYVVDQGNNRILVFQN